MDAQHPSNHLLKIPAVTFNSTLPLRLSPSRINSSYPPSHSPVQHTQAGSTCGHGNLAARLTFAAAKGREFQARAPLSALHFSELIGFSVTFSTAQRGLVELEKQQRFLSQWCNGRRLQSIFWERCIQLYYSSRVGWLLCLLNHTKDYKQGYFSETCYNH